MDDILSWAKIILLSIVGLVALLVLLIYIYNILNKWILIARLASYPKIPISINGTDAYIVVSKIGRYKVFSENNDDVKYFHEQYSKPFTVDIGGTRGNMSWDGSMEVHPGNIYDLFSSLYYGNRHGIRLESSECRKLINKHIGADS